MKRDRGRFESESNGDRVKKASERGGQGTWPEEEKGYMKEENCASESTKEMGKALAIGGGNRQT